MFAARLISTARAACSSPTYVAVPLTVTVVASFNVSTSGVAPVVAFIAADIAADVSFITYVVVPELLASLTTSAFDNVKLPLNVIFTAFSLSNLLAP